MVRIWISEIEFSNKSKIAFEKNDIVVFVGPNNAGKSASLREAADQLRQKSDRGKVVKGIAIGRDGSDAEVQSFLEPSSTKIYQGNNSDPNYLGFHYNVYLSSAKVWWSNFQNGLEGLAPFFVNSLNTTERLIAANRPQNIHLTT
ncbi:MAG: hypothetical protein ACLP05_08825 [Candidatus Kryptoniota bacterium]